MEKGPRDRVSPRIQTQSNVATIALEVVDSTSFTFPSNSI